MRSIEAGFYLRTSTGLALQHLMAAARFSHQCGQVEADNEGKPFGPFFDELIGCVSASVLLSVASLEANLNQYLFEPKNFFKDFNDGVLDLIMDYLNSKSTKILNKYQKVLSVKGKEIFDTNRNPYQDVDILIKLRNILVHFRPEWHDDQDEHKKLGEKLRGKFELSPFIGEGEGVLFPQRCFSYGCCKWAVQSSLTFMDAFAEKLGQESRFEKHRGGLIP